MMKALYLLVPLAPLAGALAAGLFGGALGRAWSQQTWGAVAALDSAEAGDRAAFRAGVAYDPRDERTLSARFAEQVETWSFVTPEELDLARSELLKAQPHIITLVPQQTDKPELCLTCHTGIEDISPSHPAEAGAAAPRHRACW